MRPIPETVEVANELSRTGERGVDVLEHLQGIADGVQELVPDCVGLSIAWLDQGVAFTLVASDEEVAVLDAVQYLTDGPCVQAAETGAGVGWDVGDPLDEERWRLFAVASAARAVRSSLTMPLRHGGAVVGTANLYAASPHAFDGHHEALAALLGGSAADVVRNADLSFASRRRAAESLSALREDDEVQHAVGVLISVFGVGPEEAVVRLESAAARAGLDVAVFARALLGLLE